MPSATRYFDLPVKRYETGTVSKYLYEREPGDTVLMSGPNPGGHWGGWHGEEGGVYGGWHGHHSDDRNHSLDSRRSFAVELLLVCANKSEADIIFREEWDEDMREHASFH